MTDDDSQKLKILRNTNMFNFPSKAEILFILLCAGVAGWAVIEFILYILRHISFA